MTIDATVSESFDLRCVGVLGGELGDVVTAIRLSWRAFRAIVENLL